MAGGRDSVCERVNVIHASSVVYAYVRSPACARALSLPVNNLCVCVCVCVRVCALKFVLVTERGRRRSVIDF